MSTPILVATLVLVEVVLLVTRWAGWWDRRRTAYVRVGVFVGFVALVVAGMVSWAPRYYLLAAWLLILALAAAIRLTTGLRYANTPASQRDHRRVGIQQRETEGGGWRMRVAAVVVGLGTLVAVSPALVFPEYRPIESTGALPVRTTTFTITDTTRVDPFSTDGEHRRVTFDVWAPEVAGDRRPLAVFSHGSMGVRSSNESLFRELASHGYVVVSVDHPAHALYSTDVEGERTTIDRGYLGDLRSENASEDPERSLQLYRAWMALRIGDLDAVLDHVLTEMPGIDPTRIGLVGHSLGGSAALAAGQARDDIVAVVALEAPFMGDIVGVENEEFVWDPEPYPVPVLAVYTDSSWEHVDQWPQYRRNHEMLQAAEARTVHLDGVGHLHLTDLALSSPALTRLLNGHSSSGDARDVLTDLNREVLGFFDAHLAP